MFQQSFLTALRNLVLLLLPVATIAQTGPGGIGNSTGSSSLPRNIIWLDASDLSGTLSDGYTWTDKSGNGYDAHDTNRSSNNNVATLGTINGRTALNFAGQSDEYLIIPDDDSGNNLLDNSSEFAVYTVYETGSQDPASIVGKRTAYNSNMAWMVYHNSGRKALSYVKNGTYGGGLSSTQGSANIQALRVNSSLSSNSVKTYLNGASSGSSGSNISIPDYSNDVLIGLFHYGDNRYNSGKIAEIIVYRDALNEAEHNILNNYLAAKYQITISSDLYAYDSTHGDEVIGIGQASDGSNNTSAQGDGILTVSSADDLDNSEYLFIGHDGSVAELIDTCDAPSFYSTRLNRVWRADKTGDLGSVSIDIDLSAVAGASSSAADYALIISSSSDFKSATVHTTGASYASNTISFTDVELTDGDYFTLAMESTNTITYNGSWSSAAPTSSDASKKVYIDAAGATISTSTGTCGCLVVNSGSLTINASSSLEVEDYIINNGSVTINHTGSLVQNHDGSDQNSGSGSYTIYKSGQTSTSAFNIWSAPIQSAQIATVFSSANPCDLYVFDAASQSWTYDFSAGYSTTCNGNSVTFSSGQVISGGDGVMDVARGYFVPGVAGGSRTFSGDINNGDISFPIYNISNPGGTNWSGDDWNMVGNPYPSAISFSDFWSENNGNGRISDGIYFWDDAGTGSYSENDYATCNSGGCTSSNSSVTPNGNIASGQGFWVVASSNTSLVFDNSMRTNVNSQFFKTNNQSENFTQVWVSLSNDSGLYNQTLVCFNELASDNYDPSFDAHKEEGNANIAFGTVLDTFTYAIQGLEPVYAGSDKVVDLYVRSEVAGEHAIQIDQSNLAQDLDIYLIDLLLDQEVLISDKNAAYAFSTNQPLNTKDRFQLRFSKKEDTTGIDEEDEEEEEVVLIPIGEGIWEMKIDNSGNSDITLLDNLLIYNMEGVVVHIDETDTDSYIFNTSDWTPGVYIAVGTFTDGHSASKQFVVE